VAIRGDSYSSVAGILALTRHLIEGDGTTFNSTTRPTLTEVEVLIDESSGLLNLSLRKYGFAPSAVYGNSTTKLACDMWVRGKTVKMVELSHPSQGFAGDNETRVDMLDGLYGAADKFVEKNALGFKRAGIAVADPSSQGLVLTGTTLQTDRSDPDNDALEQPHFTRRQFDVP